jgi:signal transduction histidine kinase
MRAIKNESQVEFDLKKPINFTMELFKSKLKKNNIIVEVNLSNSFHIYGRYGALIQIFSNLFDNSCYWLGMVPKEMRKISIQLNKEHKTITFADSGPGIDEVIRPYLFQPGYSLRIPPSGLGLYICRYYMQNNNGDLYLTPEKDRIKNFKGAQFTLDFSKVPTER